MGDFLHIPNTRKNLEPIIISNKCGSRETAVTSIPIKYSQKAFKHIASTDHSMLAMGTVVKIGQFLLKVAALEIIRRFSEVHCPLVWHGLQALQILCYPPFNWIQKWAPFKKLGKCMQNISKPVLFLSIATLLSDHYAHVEESSSSSDDSQAQLHQQSDSSTDLSIAHKRSVEEDCQSLVFRKWMLELSAELDKECLILPERINRDELYRFYNAANGDFSCFLSSIKKTINWRKNFKFLSPEQLESWSNMVFWHGRDVMRRPCLIIRLGLAYSDITSEDKSCLSEVVVSQIEKGVLHLLDAEEPQITVVMDCEGLTPFHFPLKMMRYCVILLQDHYPNCLAALFVIRLSPIARVISQALFQVLRPATRQKLRIEGENYKEVLSGYLQMLPTFLGGNCSCPKCSNLSCMKNPPEKANPVGPSSGSINTENIYSPPSAYQTDDFDRRQCPKCSNLSCMKNPPEKANLVGPSSGSINAENIYSPLSAYQTDDFDYVNCDKMLKAAILGIIVFLLSVAVIKIVYNVGII
ncbi:hypothetical protein Nepgr_015191 [Nepenthes gracilis]|uniref:CRAL-TRIO domain-containing protein n=1 Tax=Nepenthes gracilis TaxID=150966 RepID=A0AAD3XR91_NEPGR|nr:hypothetical protein Nepgr_015191 [Nepenthes gracilis]